MREGMLAAGITPFLTAINTPGLSEIGAEIIECRDADSAAAGFASGAAQASGDWLLICDPDVYFPWSTGFELLDILGRIALAGARTTLLGFAGLGIDEALGPFRAGLMVDQRALRNFPATDRAISMADFAVLLHRESPLAIDPALGQHLWATELCLQSTYGPTARFAHIVRIPILHNSVDDVGEMTSTTSFRRSIVGFLTVLFLANGYPDAEEICRTTLAASKSRTCRAARRRRPRGTNRDNLRLYQ